jgi:formylglycine-generating enzyme required for sulfatase activity
MSRHVFISYRRSDASVVDELVTALGDRVKYWRDTARIAGGQVWREEIARALDAAYAMILVVSPETEYSKEVYAEYFYALGRKVPVIPLLISQSPLPFGLENVNARLWYKDKKLANRELRGDLDLYNRRAPALEPTNDVHTYLNALQLGYLMNVGNYTPMAGEGRFHPDRVARHPEAVVMRPEFSLRRSNPLFGERQIEDRRREYDDLLPALHEAKRVLVLGEPGIGKTTTLYKFADELRLRALENDSARLPLIIPLREWRGDVAWESLIARHLGVLAPRYEQLLASGRLFFLLDGLNELPRDAREEKLKILRQILNNSTSAILTCRELDYRDESLRLDLDTITIHPLDPERVLDFLRCYLIDARGGRAGFRAAEVLFWQVAGGTHVKAIWEKWRAVGERTNFFFTASEVPDEVPTTGRERELWRNVVKSQGALMHLAANPYFLWMLLNIYLEAGTIPSNRGALFDEFAFQLMKREGLAVGDKLSAEGQGLSARLEELAWVMQRQAVASGEKRGGIELTISRSQAIQTLGAEEQLYRAASANLLEDTEPVHFKHQLLQEYFTARRMLAEINRGTFHARDLWPEERWWQSSGWEEAAVLAVGMSGQDAGRTLEWLVSANPEVAAMAMQRSGMELDDRFKIEFRENWLPQLADLERYPEAAARAAIGRALGTVMLSTGESLDNRHGVGLTDDGLPDIEWVDITGGTVKLVDVEDEFKVNTFRIARYVVTNKQFQVFAEVPNGYSNKKWWKEIEQNLAPSSSGWSEANIPRESVSWYEAVAFCRWLTEQYRARGLLKNNQEIRLPTEWEWQQAATNGNPDNINPWGAKWDSTRCNSSESGLYRITAVGLYPCGAWQSGPQDMAGNVCEWCLNKWENPSGRDATKVDKLGLRVIRGGSWKDTRWYLRTSFRDGHIASFRSDSIGFRLAQTIS